MKTIALLVCSLGLAASPVAQGDESRPAGAMGAYERVQEARNRADRLANEKSTPAELEEAAGLLRDALAYLDTFEVREWANGNPFLYGRRYDTLRDLAAVTALMGKRREALDLLELMQQEAWIPPVAKLLRETPEFASLREEPRFKAILAVLDATDRLWKVPRIATPFKEKLTVEERIAGLSLFWAEARQSFVHFDHVPDLEWDRVYLEYIPRVMAAETTADYYRVMMQLAPLLRDGHTNIYPPRELQAAFYSRPPLVTERIDGKVYVTRVRSPSLAARVRVGDEVVAIDGLAVDAYAESRVGPFVSSSTPQDRAVRMYSYQLLSGDADRPVSLQLRGADGALRTESVARKGYADIEAVPQFEFRMLPGGVAYLSLDHFESPAGVKAFEQALPQIMGAKALILDVRRNGGGSTQFGAQILSYLTADPIHNAKSRYRNDAGFLRAIGVRWAPVPGGDTVKIERKEHFAGPVAVLIGPQTFSAAEDFVLSFDVAKRGILVGSATAGSTGQPLVFAMPGGGTARLCMKRDMYPDGREFVGVGITPAIAATTTAADLRAGRDPVLDRAVAELSKR
ncbi:MAG: S41 family peptidase [Usitatibacter sp.]